MHPAPWQTEELAAAQAFIAREWAAHLHDTVHVPAGDWEISAEAAETVQRALCLSRMMRERARSIHSLRCRYCLDEESRANMEATRARWAARRKGTA